VLKIKKIVLKINQIIKKKRKELKRKVEVKEKEKIRKIKKVVIFQENFQNLIAHLIVIIQILLTLT
jgi:hypothetical protein